MAFSFAKVLEADLSRAEGGKPFKKLSPGNYQATIAKVTAQVNPETGSETKVVEYMITDNEDFNGSTIKQYINTKTGKTAKEPLSDNPIGYGQIKNLLMVAGFTEDQIAKLKPGKTGTDPGDLIRLMGRQVSLELDMGKPRTSGPQTGKSFIEVKKVSAPQAGE